MISKDKTEVHAYVPRSIKARLKALSQIDKTLYSESRVIGKSLEAHLPYLERQALEGQNR